MKKNYFIIGFLIIIFALLYVKNLLANNLKNNLYIPNIYIQSGQTLIDIPIYKTGSNLIYGLAFKISKETKGISNINIEKKLQTGIIVDIYDMTDFWGIWGVNFNKESLSDENNLIYTIKLKINEQFNHEKLTINNIVINNENFVDNYDINLIKKENKVITTKPNNITGATVSNITATSAILAWIDNLDNEDGFNIYQDNKLVDKLPKNTTFYQINNLQPNTEYKFKIVPFNDAGESENITIITIKTKNITNEENNKSNIINNKENNFGGGSGGSSGDSSGGNSGGGSGGSSGGSYFFVTYKNKKDINNLDNKTDIKNNINTNNSINDKTINDEEEFYTDIDNHWAFEKIIFMKKNKLVSGFGTDKKNMLFKPDDYIYLIDAVKIIVKSFKINIKTGINSLDNIIEIIQTNYFDKVREILFTNKLINNQIDPNSYITRLNAVKILSIIKDISEEELAKYPDGYTIFSDIELNNDTKYINYAVGKGYIEGYKDGTFKPNQYITRAEFIKLTALYAQDKIGYNPVNLTNRYIKEKGAKSNISYKINYYSKNEWCETTNYFTDIDDSYVKDEIILLKNRCVLEPEELTYFYPKKNITRRQALKIAFKVYDVKTDNIEVKKIKDVSENDPDIKIFSYALSKDLISLFDDEEFKPDNEITKTQILKILLDLKGIDTRQKALYSNAYKVFSDVKEGNWDIPYINYVVGMGYMDGVDTEGTKKFYPENPMTKEDFIKLLFVLSSDRPILKR